MDSGHGGKSGRFKSYEGVALEFAFWSRWRKARSRQQSGLIIVEIMFNVSRSSGLIRSRLLYNQRK
jgi:hypothetical protein